MSNHIQSKAYRKLIKLTNKPEYLYIVVYKFLKIIVINKKQTTWKLFINFYANPQIKFT